MKNEVEAVGKDVEDAVNNALQELQTTIEKVNVDIICEGGMFKKAKVRVQINEPANNEIDTENKKDKQNEIVNSIENLSENKQNDVTEQTKYQTYVADFLKKALQDYRQGIDVVEREQNKVFVLQVKGDGCEKLGKTEIVNALQTLLNAIEKQHNKENAKRIIVNIGDYEERRKEQLFNEATKCADQAIGEGRTIRMQPMNSYERHLIHDFLQNRPEVIAESFGVEPYRCLTIRPNDKK